MCSSVSSSSSVCAPAADRTRGNGNPRVEGGREFCREAEDARRHLVEQRSTVRISRDVRGHDVECGWNTMNGCRVHVRFQCGVVTLGVGVRQRQGSWTANVHERNCGEFNSSKLRRLKRAIPAPVSISHRFPVHSTSRTGTWPWTSARRPSMGWDRRWRTVSAERSKPRRASSTTEAAPVSSRRSDSLQERCGASACTTPTAPCGVSIVKTIDEHRCESGF